MTDEELKVIDSLISELELRAKYNLDNNDYKTYYTLVKMRELAESGYDDMASAVGLFIAQCGEMAEKNWCPAQVDMLKRLFTAVLSGKEYANVERVESADSDQKTVN